MWTGTTRVFPKLGKFIKYATMIREYDQIPRNVFIKHLSGPPFRFVTFE